MFILRRRECQLSRSDMYLQRLRFFVDSHVLQLQLIVESIMGFLPQANSLGGGAWRLEYDWVGVESNLSARSISG